MRRRPRQASRTNGERRPAYARRVGKGRLWGRGGSFGRAASALGGPHCAAGTSWSTHRKMGSSHLEPTAISGALRQVLHHGTSRIYSTRLSRSQYYATRTRPTGASESGPTGRNAIGVQPRWVRIDKTLCERNESGYPSIADMRADIDRRGFVPQGDIRTAAAARLCRHDDDVPWRLLRSPAPRIVFFVMAITSRRHRHP